MLLMCRLTSCLHIVQALLLPPRRVLPVCLPLLKLHSCPSIASTTMLDPLSIPCLALHVTRAIAPALKAPLFLWLHRGLSRRVSSSAGCAVCILQLKKVYYMTQYRGFPMASFCLWCTVSMLNAVLHCCVSKWFVLAVVV